MLHKIIGIVFILAAFSTVSSMDYADEQLEAHDTCEMVKLWLTDRDNGIPAEHRAGWPPETAAEHKECRP